MQTRELRVRRVGYIDIFHESVTDIVIDGDFAIGFQHHPE